RPPPTCIPTLGLGSAGVMLQLWGLSLCLCFSLSLAFLTAPAPTLPYPAMKKGKKATVLDDVELRAPLECVGDTIILERDTVEEQTSGGLFLPDQAKAPPNRGIVAGSGEGRKHYDTGMLFPNQVKVGDRAYFGRYDGAEVEYNGKPHLMLHEGDLLFTYTGDKIEPSTMTMIADRVLLKKAPEGLGTSDAGIILSKGAQGSDRPTIGEVIKVGSGRPAGTGELIPMRCQVGDMVKFRDFACEYLPEKELGEPGFEYAVVRNTDIVAKF
ncbi:unnamed protein product, partial [Chrysoparadoxa australica]